MRFELFLPITFQVKCKNGGKTKEKALSQGDIDRIYYKLGDVFHGCTTRAATTSAPLKGLDKSGGKLIPDKVTSYIVFVKDSENYVALAEKYFRDLKEFLEGKFEKKFAQVYEQEFVLVTYHNVQVIDDLYDSLNEELLIFKPF